MAGRGRHPKAVAAAVVAVLTVLAPANAGPNQESPETIFDARVMALVERQLEELGLDEDYFPFLRDDAKVRTGRDIFGTPSPDLNGDSMPEVLEADLRYRYAVGEQQAELPTVDSETETRIVVRAGKTGRKLWSKRYDRDAHPFSMRVGRNGRHGVVVISGLWNFFGTTEENTLTFDAFEGRTGRHLWTREYQSISYYELISSVSKDVPVVIAQFDGLEGRADDLLIGLANIVSTYVTTTTATRTVVIDGATGAEHAHPLVDVGVDWWPIPLPTGDLDGDGLDDYATTNNFGVDSGDTESQQPPSVGGTVYTRKGTDGAPIWTTSGLKMAIWAFTDGLPDVAVDRTPDVALSTYVRRTTSLPVPLPDLIPMIDSFRYQPRVYVFEGQHGAKLWHKPWEFVHSPGDIDRNGKHDLILSNFSASFKRNRTILDELAVNGYGHRLWRNRAVWRFETMPCPRNACFGGWGFWLDFSPDFQPDRVRDIFFAQSVEQNAAFEDSITRVYDGRTGSLRFEDDSERELQPAGIAIDGRGTDLMGFEYGNNEVLLTARNGSNRTLWRGTLGGPDKLVPRNSGFWAMGFRLPGDRCGDLVINGYDGNASFYGVFDGDDGRLLWSRWTGTKADRLRFSDRSDENGPC